MPKRPFALLLVLAAGAAQAQTDPGSQDASGSQGRPPVVDPGRPSDRDGLASRGGPDPIRGSHTFGEYIGTSIYSPVGTEVNRQRIAPR